MVRRKDGRWQEQMTVTVNGQTKQKYFYGSTKTEVLRKIADWKREAEEHKDKGRPFSDVADDWWEVAQEDLSPNTQRPYKAAFNRAREHFGKRDIQSITPADVAAFVRLTVKKNAMADKTARTQLMICNLIFRYAVQKGYIYSNPARDLEVPRNLKKERRDVASDQDIKIIKTLWGSDMERMANWFLYTGLRRCELLALTWEDVDMAGRTITVSKSLYRGADGKMHVKEPKTAAGIRTIPLLDALAQKLEPGAGLIFPNAGGGYITENSFSKRWANFQQEHGISCTPHQLRHATVTMYCEAVDDGKLSLQDVQHIIGHAQYQTTMDVYNHYRKQREEKAKNAVLQLDFTA